MITIVGTGHVFDLSDSLNSLFDEKRPDVICVELDSKRYNAIMMRQNNPKAFEGSRKNLPFIYRLLAKFQDSMASEYGVNAGDEMLTAINYANSHGLSVEYIDMDAQVLFINMWKSMPFSEKFKLMLSGFGGLFVSKRKVESELKNIQDNFDKYIEEIGKNFPTIKKTLIDKRNIHMVNRILALADDYEEIIACVGDGHIPGISRLLEDKNVKFETVRLSELRNQDHADVDSAKASFSINFKDC